MAVADTTRPMLPPMTNPVGANLNDCRAGEIFQEFCFRGGELCILLLYPTQ